MLLLSHTSARQVKLTLMNPNSEHLDSWNLPLLVIQPIFLGLTLLGILLLILNFILNEKQSSNLYKHVWLCFVADLMFYSVGTMYWRVLSENGIRETYLLILVNSTHALTQLAQLTLILAIGYGYGIITTKLEPIQLLGAFLAASVAGAFIIGNLLSLYALFMAVPFIVALLFVFARSVNHNLRDLEADAKQASSDSLARLEQVHAFLSKSRMAIVVYLILLSAVRSFGRFLSPR